MNKIMVVAPGSDYSTFDMYRYYLKSYREVNGRDSAFGFVYNNFIQYHLAAMEAIGYKSDEVDLLNIAASRGARELIVDYLIKKPDVVLFVDGTRMPPDLYSHLDMLRNELNRDSIIAAYFTEAPYLDDITGYIEKHLDVLFINDKYSYQKRNPNDDKFVFYLPHSFKSDIHYPGDVEEKYKSDLFFCGTVYPERLKIFKSLKLDNISAKIMGFWIDEIPESMKHIAENRIIDNEEVANYYRGCKIALNIHRRISRARDWGLSEIEEGSAYSVNPRLIEAAACGAFQITDYRPEVKDLFGDSVVVFDDHEDLQLKIEYYLKHEDERIDMAQEAMERVQDYSYRNRAEWMIEIFNEALDTLRLIKEKENG